MIFPWNHYGSTPYADQRQLGRDLMLFGYGFLAFLVLFIAPSNEEAAECDPTTWRWYDPEWDAETEQGYVDWCKEEMAFTNTVLFPIVCFMLGALGTWGAYMFVRGRGRKIC